MKLTKSKILKMGAGHKMDALIHERFFNYEIIRVKNLYYIWEQEPIPCYSTFIGDAWLVVDELIRRVPGGDFHIEHLYGEWAASCCLGKKGGGWEDFTPAKTVELAICRAALLQIL